MHWRRRELLIATGLCVFLPRVAGAQAIGVRRLDLKNAHTGETFNGPYRDKDGPIPSAVTDLGHFLRDFHANQMGPVNVATLDFLADVMAATNQQTATILSAYRTKHTNDMLRSAFFPAAEKSQHLVGRAIDVAFDSRLHDAEQTALSMKRGGVGWYPNAHFLHLDSGPIRYWQIGASVGRGRGLPFIFLPPPSRRQLFVIRVPLRLRHR